MELDKFSHGRLRGNCRFHIYNDGVPINLYHQYHVPIKAKENGNCVPPPPTPNEGFESPLYLQKKSIAIQISEMYQRTSLMFVIYF